MIVVFCDCGARFFVPDQHAGKRVKCRHCGGPIPVPLPGQEAEDDAEAYAVEVVPDDKEEITIRDVVAVAPASGAVAAVPSRSAAPAGGRLIDYLNLRVGCWTAVGGAAAAVLLRWFGFGGIGLIVGVLCGLVTMGCGLQVFRARRLPPQAQRFTGTEMDIAKGVLLALFGLALILLSVLL